MYVKSKSKILNEVLLVKVLHLFPVQENLGFFKAEEDTDIWRAYVDYVDDMVVDGFFNAIHCSLNFLLEIMGSKGQVRNNLSLDFIAQV